jgi:hypothetical protein
MSQLVKDFQGNLIPKTKARRIKNENGKFEWFEQDVSCIRMPDGFWYRTTTGKIIFDWSIGKWVFVSEFSGNKGLVEDGSFGCFSDRTREVTILFKKDSFSKKTVFDPLSKHLSSVEFNERKWNRSYAISEEVAIKHGYEESLFDGMFYKLSDCAEDDLIRMKTPNIPSNERSNTYSLDDDRNYRSLLEDCYDNYDLTIPKSLNRFARFIPFTWGLEIEIQNGFVPKRIREPLGYRVCRDGSLDTGQEYVSIPRIGGKGLAADKKMCYELTKRCILSNKCSVHVHFGEVRRDKLYVISLWTLFFKIQEELRKYFPFSRTNSIREDGKIYAGLLPDLSLKVSDFLKIKTDEEFKARIGTEFGKIYTWLNHGHPLGEQYDEKFVKETRTEIIKGKKQTQICYRVKTYNFTTKLPRHAVQGRKWERKERYLAMNVLNLFFSHSKTIEFRISEGTTNFDKILLYMCLNVAILKYAENFEKVFNQKEIFVEQIIKDHFPEKESKYIIDYLEVRKTKYCNVNGSFRSNWKSIEESMFTLDKEEFKDHIYKL